MNSVGIFTTTRSLQHIMDIDQEIRDYYKNFYGIELADEDMNTLYNPL